MIIAYGLLIPTSIIVLFGLFILPYYNKLIRDGKIVEKEHYDKQELKEITYSYIIMICCLQYIYG